MPLDWTPIFQETEKEITVQVSTAEIRGRAAYSLRIGKLRDDGHVGAFIPLAFHSDNGASRSGVDLRPVQQLLERAADAVESHVFTADRDRATKVFERDATRADRDAQRLGGNSTVGRGLSKFHGEREPETLEQKAARERKRQERRDRDRSEGMAKRGKKS